MADSNLNSEVKTILDSDFIGGLQSKFSDMTETIEDAGQTAFRHVRGNRMTYMSLAVGAVVLGGAYLLYRTWQSGQSTSKLVTIKPNLSRAKRKAARAKIH